MKRKLTVILAIICALVFSMPVFAGTWEYDGTGWFYIKDDGTVCINEWGLIDGEWYYFGNDCNMLTGWQYIGGETYYFDPISGAMYHDRAFNGGYCTNSGAWISDMSDYGDTAPVKPHYYYDNDGDIWYYTGSESNYIGPGSVYYIGDDGQLYGGGVG